MKETKIQWHPGFVAAMNLEFSTKPLEVDLLIIKNMHLSIYQMKLERFSGDIT